MRRLLIFSNLAQISILGKVVVPNFGMGAFTNKDRFYLATVDEETVSNNTVLDLRTLRQYDTFITVLYLIRLEKVGFDLSKAYSIDDLMALYSIDFYDALSYANPRNQAKGFKDMDPIFVFRRPLESDLIKIMEMVYRTGNRKTSAYLRKAKALHMPNSARRILIANLKVVKLSKEIEVTAEKNSTTSPTPQ